MGKGSAKQEVVEYYMSIHMGLCGGGPPDSINEIIVGEKLAWVGEVSAETAIAVSAPELFGGPKKEGGVGGIAYYLPGGRDQVMPDALARRFGLTSQTCPGFRGFPSIFFVGSNNYGSADSGVIAPPSGGGGGGGGGDGGGGYEPPYSGGGGGYCVVADSWLAGGVRADKVTLDTALMTLDYETMNRVERRACIQHIRFADNQPCVGIVTESGIRLGVSTATPLTLRDGSTPNVLRGLGKEVPVVDGNGFRWERIVELVNIGNRRVVHIDADNATFAAGTEQHRFVLTHNIRANKENQVEQ